MKHRPIFPNATVHGSLIYDVDQLDSDYVENIMRRAGTFLGVGAGRGIGYSRFVVKKFSSVLVPMPAGQLVT